MEWEKLFLMQHDLDRHIADKRGIESNDLYDERILALFVEIGELANEERSFKFWSNKPRSAKRIILEEFIDCIHFMLSIGNLKKFNTEFNKFRIEAIREDNITNLFIGYFHKVSDFDYSPTLFGYIEMWEYLLSIGKKLEFTKNDIYNAYLEKNKINHNRQEVNY